MRILIGSFLLMLASFTGFAEPSLIDYSDDHKIGVQNAILAKVNGTTISMMDVKKKMDLLFHQSYPHLSQSAQARFQFYQANWRHALTDMIDGELILADATDKEVKLSDGDVREEIEKRFGPNVAATLDKIGLTYEETWRLIKNELLIQRMNWWFIHSKALAKVTPQDIRQAYRLHLQEHPAYTECKYRVLTLRGSDPARVADELYPAIQQATPDTLTTLLKEWEPRYVGTTIALSTEYTAADTALSEAHRSALTGLTSGTYSQPIVQTGRDKKQVCRIFYLSEKTEHPAVTFDEMAPLLKNQLLQQTSNEISQNYLNKLRSHYRFDASHLSETLPQDLQPFSIE